MSFMDGLYNFIEEGRSFELIEEGIYSVLDNTPHFHQYDKRAALYDFLVGTRIYNRLLWGESPDNYVAFAHTADNSQPQGPVLDAGCGSLLFTAKAHLGCGRVVIACDQSLGMLRRARARLMKLSHSDSGNIILVQADLSDLPFRRNIFHTVLCMNVLHHYSDAAILIQTLETLLSVRGHLYLTSLVLSNRLIGDNYLSLLYKKGWIVRPRSAAELNRLIGSTLQQSANIRTEGNMAYISMPEVHTQ
jgi:2-polyprenyl-3-methyl-5-hydroxy-6-metoxy-1,4-benzoquinol methylase